MRTTSTVKVAILVAAIGTTYLTARSQDIKEEVKEFRGQFVGPIWGNCGSNKFLQVPIFVDPARPPVVKGSDDKVSDKILNDICKNGDNLKQVPAAARKLGDGLPLSPGQKPIFDEALHIAVYPLKTIKISDEIKSPAYFEPASITKLVEVVKKYGEPTERERWETKQLRSSVGLNGTVRWWGAVGIAASDDGTITHVLIREKEGLIDNYK